MARQMLRHATILTLLALSALSAGCTLFYRPLKMEGASAAGGTGAPTPPRTRNGTITEYGVRSLRLEYSLPGRGVAPVLKSWEQIKIVDEANMPCPVQNIQWGKTNDNTYWTSVSFSVPPEARRIVASFVLSLDNQNYPLSAILTRLDATHWRVDYGITPPN